METWLEKRYLRCARWSRVLISLPFTRAIILNGSLASGTSKKSSDIDLLIIAKPGRIFTTRFFVNVLGTLTFIKRTSSESNSHANLFCFNYFLTENFLKIPVGRGKAVDDYCADNYSKSVLVAGDRIVFDKFMKENSSLFGGRKLADHKKFDIYFKNTNSRNYSKIITEYLLGSKVGDGVEIALKVFQKRLIETDSRTKKYPEYIVYNDCELRFHPPKNKKISI
ncbi:MAG: nucleotidyltransferase domain-containing protein [Candidatus Berkelbacteria bacterium]